MNLPFDSEHIDLTRPAYNFHAIPREIEAQRAGMLNYKPGERNCMPRRTPYVSIDIETTGTDPNNCQIIEFGAVLDNWVTPVEQLPRFHCYVFHNRIIGQPFALQMNASILKTLAAVENDMEGRDYLIDETHGLFLRPNKLAAKFSMWLNDVGVDQEKPIQAAGKNFAGFDRPFLEALATWDIPFFRRVIDPGMLYWQPDVDTEPPSTQTCLDRAGIPGTVKHTALEDALDIVRLVRAKFKFDDHGQYV